MKDLKILYLYPDILELYGDFGNIQVLKYRLEQRGFNAIIEPYSIGDTPPNFEDYDLVFAGGGADQEQSILAKDLIKYKDNIKTAIDKGVFFLLICGAYQLFGKYYKDVDGNIIPGLKIFDYYTEAINDSYEKGMGSVNIYTIKWICYILNISLGAGAVLVTIFYVVALVGALLFFLDMASRVKK